MKDFNWLLLLLLLGLSVLKAKAMIVLPNATQGCAVFASVGLAESACAGEFLMWGDFQPDSSLTNLTTVFGDEPGKARFGPYRCSDCAVGGLPGIGYVCENGDCPDFHTTDHLSDQKASTLPDCPRLELAAEEIQCADLQRVCEEKGFGWLVEAETFDTELGFYRCAKCDLGHVYGMESAPDSLTALPMLVLYGVIGSTLLIASIIDLWVYLCGSVSLRPGGKTLPDIDGDGHANTVSQWKNKFILAMLGYVDHDGNKNWCIGQIYFNRFNCCGKKSRGGLLNFVSVLLMTLGTSAIFKGGSLFAFRCYFDSKGPKTGSISANLTQYWENEFTTERFGVLDRDKGGLPILDITSLTYMISELVVVLYQFSINMLSNALDNSGQMKTRKTLRFTIIFAALFCAASFAYEWNNLDAYTLFLNWVIGFLIVFAIIGPIASGLAYFLAVILLKCGILRRPPAPNSNKNLSTHV